jgi:murein DD-endopeptidase MepM/ murein hydrolase activator NlpD
MMPDMQNKRREDDRQAGADENRQPAEIPSATKRERGLLSRWMNNLIQMGLGESLLHTGTNLLSILALGIVIWLAQMFYRQAPAPLAVPAAQAAGPTPTAAINLAAIPPMENPATIGILRSAQIHTNVPTRPRQETTAYLVEEGDTVFGISEKFGLEPQTILWGNYNILLDDPHNLQPGQELTILPVNGTYYEWQQGDGLNGVGKFFGVDPEIILNYPGNHLDPAAVGDLTRPDIKPGTWLIIPGGKREFVSWSAPLGVTRENPAYARVLGPGFCDPVAGGAVGFGYYVWPVNRHYRSGFDYSPKSNHWGVDLAGNTGEGVYAVDAGVVVYSGWNNYGYGNMIIIDHGNGFQSLYAHLSELYVGCGASVGQGDGIGAVGSTGRSSGSHLHFELMTATFKVNPWDYLPPP